MDIFSSAAPLNNRTTPNYVQNNSLSILRNQFQITVLKSFFYPNHIRLISVDFNYEKATMHFPTD